MNNIFTIHYPTLIHSSCITYKDFLTPSIVKFDLVDTSQFPCEDLKAGGLWEIILETSNSPLYLDRDSYIITPEGIKFEFQEFSRFARYITNMNLEKDIDVL